MNVFIDFNTGDGFQDISSKVRTKNFKRTQALHKKLQPTVNSCRFNILGEPVLITTILNSKDANINIKNEDNTDYFTGSLKNTFSGKMETRLKDLKVEVVDYSWKLKNKIKISFSWEAFKICDNSNKSSSIIHQFLYLAGLGDGDINCPDIDKTIEYFVIDKEEYFDKILTSLLGEFGYVFNFNEAGQFVPYKIIPDDLSTENQLNNSNMIGKLEFKKNEEKKESVTVEWWSLQTDPDQVVFSDTTGGSSAYKCSIPLNAYSHYPDGASTNTVYSEYKYNDFEILSVKNAYYDFTADSAIRIQNWLTEANRAFFSVYNDSAIINRIYKFDIRGDVVFKKTLNKEIVSNISETEKEETIDARFISSQTDAHYLAEVHALYYKYSDFTYSTKSKSEFSVGSIVRLIEAVDLNIDNICLVTSRLDDGKGNFIYSLEGVASYTFLESDTEIVNVQPSPVPSGQATPVGELPDLSHIPTLEQIETGWSSDNMTVLPSDVFLKSEGAYKSILLRWDQQDNLSNLKEYQIQVSDNDENWFSLCFDGTDFKKGEENSYTTWNGELLLHTPVPFAGTEENPEGKKLFYRIRRYTKKNDFSDWSNTISNTNATTRIIKGSEIIDKSITVDKLATNILESMFANIQNTLVIGKNYSGDTPSVDAKRCVLINEQINIESWDGSKWTIEIGFGARDIENNYLPYMTARGIANPNAQIPSALGGIPTNDCITWTFNDTLESHNEEGNIDSYTGSFVPGKFDNAYMGTFVLDKSHIKTGNEISFSYNKTLEGDYLCKLLESKTGHFLGKSSGNTYYSNQYNPNSMINYDGAVTSAGTVERGTVSTNGWDYKIPITTILTFFNYTNSQWARAERNYEIYIILGSGLQPSLDISPTTKTIESSQVGSFSTSDYLTHVFSYHASKQVTWENDSIDELAFFTDFHLTEFGQVQTLIKITFPKFTDVPDGDDRRLVTFKTQINEYYPFMEYAPVSGLRKYDSDNLEVVEFNESGASGVAQIPGDSEGMVILQGNGNNYDLTVISGEPASPVGNIASNIGLDSGFLETALIDPIWDDISIYTDYKTFFDFSSNGWIDDLMYSPSEISQSDYLKHYFQNVVWNPYYTDGDIVLAPSEGGKVIVFGELHNETIALKGEKGQQGVQGEQGGQGIQGEKGEQGSPGISAGNLCLYDWSGSVSVPTNSDIDNAVLHEFNISEEHSNIEIWIRGLDFEGAIHLAFNNTTLGTMNIGTFGLPDNSTAWFKFFSTSAIGLNRIAIWSTTADAGIIYDIKIFPTGLKGEQGRQGIQGEKGDTGGQGLQGEKGDTGDQGLQGEKGDTGDQGLQGEKGETGSQGIPGFISAPYIFTNSYNENEFVIYNGSLYYSVIDNNSENDIDNTDYWKPFLYPEISDINTKLQKLDTAIRFLTINSWQSFNHFFSSMYSICYSEQLQLFVIVGTGSSENVWYSTDANSWNPVSVADGNIRAVCYSESKGMFVAVGSGSSNHLIYSADGKTWTQDRIGNASLYGVCCSESKGLFVAVGSYSGGLICYSSDCQNWELVSAPSPASTLRSICFSEKQGKFVAVGSSTSSPPEEVAVYSTDGKNWTTVALPYGSLSGVCFSEELELFVAVGFSSSNNIQYSSDGETWTPITVPQGYLNSVCYSSKLGLFVAVGSGSINNIQYSYDGKNWKQIKVIDGNYYDVCYSDKLEKFVSIGIGTSYQICQTTI